MDVLQIKQLRTTVHQSQFNKNYYCIQKQTCTLKTINGLAYSL